MSKRRVSSRTVSDIASKRMSTLYRLSEKAEGEGNTVRSGRYMELARRIGQKTKTPFPKEMMFCKRCNMPLSIGTNCRVRLGDGRVRITCMRCGDIRRIQYRE